MKDVLPNKNDFELTYEGHGTTLINEDLVRNFYMTGECIGFYQNATTTTFSSKKTLEKMRKIGESRTPTETKKVAKLLLKLIKQTEIEARKYEIKKDFNKNDARHMFEVIEKICKGYFYFDFSFWDSVFEKSKNDKGWRENVKLVEKFKNYIRDELNAVFFTPNSYFKIILKRVHEKTGIPLNDLDWYTHQEVIASFSGNKVSKTEIISRKKASAYYIDRFNKLHLYSGAKAQKIIDSFSKIEKNKSIIKGMVAHGKGKMVKGKVCLLHRDYGDPTVLKRSMDAMKHGEILVSQTTDPSLMPAFHKASAVITDTGGLLSHAAITARELDIPCIVGTGSASKILKTGDLVEVDADKGVIKILK